MDRPQWDSRLVGGPGRTLLVAVGLCLLLGGGYVLSATVEAGPTSGLAAGVVASALGIELVAFGLTGRRFP